MDATCTECETIALELCEAYADAWIFSDQESRDAWIATYKLIGGTEKEALRAEELVSSAQFRDPLRINQAELSAGSLLTKLALDVIGPLHSRPELSASFGSRLKSHATRK
jgi:hypothetical protein